MSTVHHRKKCRCCNSENLMKAVTMASTPVGDAYISSTHIDKPVETYPVALYFCQDCGLVQLLEVIEPDEIYTDYIYKTSDSLGLVEHFSKAVETICEKIELPQDAFIIDVGSNDGSYLQFYKQRGFKVLGVEPARVIAEEANRDGIPTINDFFTESLVDGLLKEHQQANMLTINNCIANLDDLRGFVNAVKKMLIPGGVLVFETGYVLDLLNKKIFDNIYHEHLTYFSVKPLKAFFKSMGMTLVDVERTYPKGGSLRCYVFNDQSSKESESVAELISLEEESGIDTFERIQQFGSDLDDLKSTIVAKLKELKEQGKTVVGYGASVGVTTALYNFGLKPYLDYLVDDNPRRQGLYSPGLNVLVKSPQAIYDDKIDYVIILAWMYKEPIMSKHQRYLEEGGHFINILQDFEII